MNTSDRLSRWLRRQTALLICLSTVSCLAQTAMSPAAAQADRLEREGHFKEAAAVLKRALQAKPLAAPEQKNLEFELDRLERIKKDFPFTEDTLLDEVQSGVKYLTRPEFE